MTFVVPLGWTKLPLSVNRRENMHRMAVAKLKREMLDDARKAIRRAYLPPIGQCIVILNWRHPDNRNRDGDGAYLALKAVLDALVKEQILEDDNFKIVRHSGITSHDPIKGQPGGFWLTIDPL